jgi:hypothetical protein
MPNEYHIQTTVNLQSRTWVPSQFFNADDVALSTIFFVEEQIEVASKKSAKLTRLPTTRPLHFELNGICFDIWSDYLADLADATKSKGWLTSKVTTWWKSYLRPDIGPSHPLGEGFLFSQFEKQSSRKFVNCIFEYAMKFPDLEREYSDKEEVEEVVDIIQFWEEEFELNDLWATILSSTMSAASRYL